MHEAYRQSVLASMVREQRIKRAVGAFRSSGLEPILLKGWAVERLYPEPGLRPSGDIDIVVYPWQVEDAARVIGNPDSPVTMVDLHHADFGGLDERGWHDLYARSRLVPLGDVQVRVLSPEDQLAHLCLHFLRHSGSRPLWLVDIAVALESRPSHFDWNLCLGPDPRRADYVACAIGVAHQLVGAAVDGTPVAERAKHLPSWLIPLVLRHWEQEPFGEFVTGDLIRSSLRRPWTLPRELGERWPDPILATVRVRGPFNELPRFPFQVAAYSLQTARLARRLPEMLRAGE